MSEYYDGTKLLSKKDLNGNTPELFLCTGNRTGGKTVYFSRHAINRYKNHKEKFILLYRYNYELDDCAETFFKDIKGLFFPYDTLTSERRASGIYHELMLNGFPCGYAIALNNADQIKRKAHLFSDAQRIIFDEFQSETNHYCADEVKKFISIHTSIARGQGKQVRYLPVIMISNSVSILNPYYTELNISSRLDDKTRFLRGDGFVLEQAYVESASKAQKTSGFNRAFAGNKYVAYASENVYLNDNKAFVEKPEGNSRYLATLKYKGKDYGIREYAENGFIYCDTSADSTFKYKITVTTDDHDINYVMLKRNDLFLSQLRYYFERGCFRFKDLNCKEAVLKSLSY